jgi:hypothetical protein
VNNPKNPENDPGKPGYDPRNPSYDPDHSAAKGDDKDPSTKKSVDAPRHGGEAASKAPKDADPDARRDPSNPHPRDPRAPAGDEDPTAVQTPETDPDYLQGGKYYVPPQPAPMDEPPPNDGGEPLPPQAPGAGEVRQREHDIDPDLGKDAQQPDAKEKGRGRDK